MWLIYIFIAIHTEGTKRGKNKERGKNKGIQQIYMNTFRLRNFTQMEKLINSFVSGLRSIYWIQICYCFHKRRITYHRLTQYYVNIIHIWHIIWFIFTNEARGCCEYLFVFVSNPKLFNRLIRWRLRSSCFYFPSFTPEVLLASISGLTQLLCSGGGGARDTTGSPCQEVFASLH